MRASDPHFFQRLCDAQNPHYLWIGCSDSRVPANQARGVWGLMCVRGRSRAPPSCASPAPAAWRPLLQPPSHPLAYGGRKTTSSPLKTNLPPRRSPPPGAQIIGLAPGDVFVQRNVGNQALHTDLNVMSCLEYAINELKARAARRWPERRGGRGRREGGRMPAGRSGRLEKPRGRALCRTYPPAGFC